MFITFYSYKGGVGRSTSLINIAYYLAQTGRDIFIIDFDLEAPGLHKMPCFKNKNTNQYLKSKSGGLVEYVTKYIKEKKIPDLREYVIEIEVDVINNDIKFEKTKSKLFLLSAGNTDNNDYTKNLKYINWKNLYEKQLGYYLIENLKKDILDIYNIDYVFIDSRTGYNDVTGISTIQIPETIVLIFGLNEQNLEGIKNLYPSLKNKNIIPVLSPIPEHIDEPLSKKIDRISTELVFDKPIYTVSYNSFLSGKETIVFIEKYFDIMGISNQYIEISKEIVKNQVDVITLRENLKSDLNKISRIDYLIENSKVILDKSTFSIDHFHHSILLFRNNDFHKSKKYIDKALSYSKINNIDIYYLEMLILLKLDQDEELNEKIDRFISIYSEDFNNLKIILNVLKEKNDINKYEIVFQKLIHLEKSNIEPYLHMSMMYYKNENFYKSLEIITNAINLSKKNKDVNLQYLRCLYKLRKYSKLLTKIEELYGSGLEYEILAIKANSLYNLNNYKESLSIYDSFMENKEIEPYFYCSYSIILFSLGEYAKSIEYVNKGINLYKNNIEMQLMLVEIYITLDLIDKAKNILENLEFLIQINKHKFENYFQLIIIYSNLSDQENMNLYFNLLKKLLFSKNKSKFYFLKLKRNIAYSLMLLHRYEEAISLYKEENVISDFVNEEAYFNIAFAYLNIEQYSNMLKYLNIFVKKVDFFIKKAYPSKRINLLLCKSISLSYLKENDKAIETIELTLKEFYNENKIIKFFSPEFYRYVDRKTFEIYCLKIKNNIYNKNMALYELINKEK